MRVKHSPGPTADIWACEITSSEHKADTNLLFFGAYWRCLSCPFCPTGRIPGLVTGSDQIPAFSFPVFGIRLALSYSYKCDYESMIVLSYVMKTLGVLWVHFHFRFYTLPVDWTVLGWAGMGWDGGLAVWAVPTVAPSVVILLNEHNNVLYHISSPHLNSNSTYFPKKILIVKCLRC